MYRLFWKGCSVQHKRAKIYNVSTGEYKDYIVVPPGESAKVAVLTAGGHYRGYVNSPLGPTGSNISFWYPISLGSGWWYSVGCDDGTKPDTNCNSMTGGQGERSFSECRTKGQSKK